MSLCLQCLPLHVIFFKSLFSVAVRVDTLMEKIGTRNTQEFDVRYLKYYS